MIIDPTQRQAVVDQLKRWQDDGIPVAHLWRQDRHFVYVAIRTFGSWRAALKAASIPSTRNQWSQERILEKLRERRKTREPVEPKLRSAAKRYFGSITKAYAAAGITFKCKPIPHADWTSAQAVAAIQARHRTGASLRATHRDDPALYAASKRLHGSWHAALEAAGLAPPSPQRLTAEEVIARIQDRQAAGLTLVNIDRHDPLLFLGVRKHFGGWRKALLAAGVPTKVTRRWTKRSVVAAMRERHRRGEPLSTVWRDDKALFRAAVTHLGGWASAMRAAGFQPPPRERWSKKRVLERLQVCDERCGASNLRDVDPNLSAAAARLFGSYHLALEAAGLEPPARYWTDARVLAAIQDRYIAGHPLHIEGLGDLRLSQAAKRRFGSWQAAVEAAGLTSKIPIKKPLRRWSPEEVIKEIQDWNASGQQLNEISYRNQSLYNAAKAHFGSWGAARSAAGFEPTRRSWSKQAVIDEILARVRRGESLSSGQPANKDLAVVAYRYFGSWRKAIEAAEVHRQLADSKGA